MPPAARGRHGGGHPIAHLDGLDIAYEEHGAGDPLVLVSGIGMQLVGWPLGFIDLLVARGFRVIVLDNRDVGLSSKLTAHGVPPLQRLMARALLGLPVNAPYTLFDMAGDVVGLLDALGIERAHVAGVSLGGMVAQAMAIAHGDRMKSLVSLMSYPGGRVLTAGDPRVTWRLLRRTANHTLTTRKKTLDPAPLHFCQLITTYAHPYTATNLPPLQK